jgi:hypothetical protein
MVMRSAPEVDAWTIYHALSTPSGAVGGRPPIEVVKLRGQSPDAVAKMVLEEMGIHAEPA